MIDISNEELIPIREVPRRLPRRPSGKRVHISAVYRWLNRGVRGFILESCRIGGTTYTSQEALQRFADRLSSADTDTSTAPPPTGISRQKQIDAATCQVESILGRNRNRQHPA